ncbi:MAG: ribonuclease R [Cyclobacteriaceae bacterium]
MNKKRKKSLRGAPGHKRREPNQINKIKSELHKIFSVNDGKAYSYRDLIRKLVLQDRKSKEFLKTQLFGLESKEKIRRMSDGRYVSTAETEYIQGKVDHVNPNFAYILTPDGEEDIWVKTGDLKFAIHGDLVNVILTKASGNGFRPEGKVVSIAKRNRDEFVGRIEISNKFSFVVPDNRHIHFDVFVYPEKIGKAKPNDKVMVKITKWHDQRSKNPMGEVTEVLGQAGENEAEIHSIMAEFGLPFRFTQKVEKEADKISDLITKDEIKKRKDFRDVTTFTVDPFDAKDFDDALSFREIEKDKYEIGIHIADVSHYVEPDTILDKEAVDRATSVYLVDRTIPMLPERLSNGLCSLRPNEEKLTFAAVFEIDGSGTVSKKWFGRTIINSDRRFTYEEAQERIEGLDSDFTNEVVTLNNIAKKLRKQRFQHGAVNFETVEVKFQLDENGKPLKVIPKERKDAHKMIEEFMLLANREVATHIYKWKEKGKDEGSKTFVYRVHDDPDPEKLSTFASFAAKFGHKVEMNKNISTGLNKLMETIQGKPEQNVLESLAIRSMAKAKYTTDPRGHFGLAFEHYSHFTSPIRRYPDVMVHRLLQHYLDKGRSVETEDYEALCLHSSEREKRAADAERASIKYKQVEFMQSMLGQEFEGIVSGVTEWGIFVEIIETKCEGMVRLADLTDDHYEFDEKNYRVIGRRNKKIITLGDSVKVRVAKTDIDRRTIDLEMTSD